MIGIDAEGGVYRDCKDDSKPGVNVTCENMMTIVPTAGNETKCFCQSAPLLVECNVQPVGWKSKRGGSERTAIPATLSTVFILVISHSVANIATKEI